jgi:hypothetical protein
MGAASFDLNVLKFDLDASRRKSRVLSTLLSPVEAQLTDQKGARPTDQFCRPVFP